MRELKVVGAKSFSESELIQAMGANPPSRWRLFKKELGWTRTELDEGVANLVRYLNRRGYFEASAVVASLKDGTAVVHVSEGPASYIYSLTVNGADRLKPGLRMKLGDLKLPLRKGEVFTVEAYEGTRRLLERWMKDHGYPFAKTEPDAVVDMKDHRVVVSYELKPGEFAVFGEVVLKGVPESEKITLKRAMTFSIGAPYNQSEVNRSVTRMYELGAFTSATLSPVKTGTPGAVRMVGTLQVGKVHRIKAGIGYGSVEEVRATLGWETSLFRKRLMTLGFQTRDSAIETRFSGEVRVPYFWTGDNTLLGGLTANRRVEQNFVYKAVKANFGMEHRFSDTLKGSISGVLERVLQVTPDQILEEALARGTTETATMASTVFSLTWDTTDHPLDPTRGSILSADVEPTLVLGDGTRFDRLILQGRHYWPLPRGFVFATKLKVGAILTSAPTERIPVTRRFYAGGPNSIRGYRYDHLGPLSPTGVLIGGEGLVESSVELRFPIRGKLSGLLFTDAGNAYRKGFSFKGAKTMVGSGFGLRYMSPVGPVGADFAWKVRKDPTDPSPFLFYLFVGYAF
ncbi:MAG: BamA/TamA family outer membrane protein [Acidobacteriota bacterium]